MRIHLSRISVRFLLAALLGAVVVFVSTRNSAQAPEQPPARGQFDGPAELPRVLVKSALSDTPAPGRIRKVGRDGDLQKALESASCGDTIQLEAGATYPGVWTLPAKPCDDSHWIIIRTSAPDSALPPEGTRLTPCYAGIAFLPGRPPYNCPSPKDAMAHLVFDRKTGDGPIIFASGANHYRLLGLDITRHEGGLIVYHLASVQQGGTADHIVYDRLWMHGSPQDEIKGGIQFGGSRYVAVVDSYFSDFHCIARTGACTDGHAIAGGNGKNPMGPYKIVNNFLEAGGEPILFGGGPATQTPADIEISHNHFFKPLLWKKGQPDFRGGADGQPFIVKNLFELKNAKRVLFEDNLLDNSWGGFTQVGFAILLTPQNQSAMCPDCEVTDVTIRYCKISHLGSGMQISNPLADNTPGAHARDGQRYSIHDVIFDDIDAERFDGPGKLFQVSQGPGAPLLQNVSINHITAFPPRVLLNLGSKVENGKMSNFAFTNSIINAGERPITSTTGAPDNCSFQALRLAAKDALGNCFTGLAFHHNVVIGGGGGWPADNFPVKKPADVGFVNFNNGSGGDYHLRPDSRFKKAASDGKDVGADVDAVTSAVAGVE